MGTDGVPAGRGMEEQKILLVTGDRTVGERAEEALWEGGYAAIVTRPSWAMQRARDTNPDLILLDMQTGAARPGFLREITHSYEIPLILMADSGSRAVPEAFRLGAADCVTDPLDGGETLARVRAVLWRRTPGQRDGRGGVLRFGDLTIDLPARTAELAGRPIHLTYTEFRTLAFLARNAGRVVPQAALAEQDWNRESMDERSWPVTASRDSAGSWATTPGTPPTSQRPPGWGTGSSPGAPGRSPRQGGGHTRRRMRTWSIPLRLENQDRGRGWTTPGWPSAPKPLGLPGSAGPWEERMAVTRQQRPGSQGSAGGGQALPAQPPAGGDGRRYADEQEDAADGPAQVGDPYGQEPAGEISDEQMNGHSS